MMKIKDAYRSEAPVAIVYPTGYPVGFGVAKALAQEDVKVVALDSNPDSVAKYSRSFSFICETGIKDPTALFSFLKKFVKKFRVKPVLFLVDDEDIVEAFKRYEELSEYMHLAIGDRSVESLIDKTAQYKKFQQCSVPLPKVFFAGPEQSNDISEIENKVGYPCVVKPDISGELRVRTGKKVLLCESKIDLEKAINVVESFSERYVVQEYIPGGVQNLYTFGSYVSKDRKKIAYFTGHKIRQFPPDFGTCRCGETVQSKELEEAGISILKALDYSGISQIELKQDPKDGKFKVIEINVRAWLWISLALASGVNIPYAAYCDVVGKDIPDSRQSPKKIIWINLFEDLLNVLHGYKACGYRDYSCSLWDWMKSISGQKEYAFFSWKDPLPAIVRTWQFLKGYSGMIKKQKA